MDSLYESNSKGENLPRNRSTKKVRFKDLEPTSDVEMVVEPTPTPTLSWKDMVLGKGDVKKSVINGIYAIDFLDRVQKLLVKDMSTSVTLKLLGRNIGVVALQNKASIASNSSKEKDLVAENSRVFDGSMAGIDEYGPWMLVERNAKHTPRDQSNFEKFGNEEKSKGSRYNPINPIIFDEMGCNLGKDDDLIILKRNEKEIMKVDSRKIPLGGNQLLGLVIGIVINGNNSNQRERPKSIITNNGLNCLDRQSDGQNVGSNGSLGTNGVLNDPLECVGDVGDKVTSIHFNPAFEDLLIMSVVMNEGIEYEASLEGFKVLYSPKAFFLDGNWGLQRYSLNRGKKCGHVAGQRCSFFGELVDTTQVHDLDIEVPLLLGIVAHFLR
ncbi:hypothetical protein Gorai_019690, partial [Gossypium raimondii]|nr:hypothetical protein [Gossypium raimondii]